MTENCGQGHDTTKIGCKHAAAARELEQLRAQISEIVEKLLLTPDRPLMPWPELPQDLALICVQLDGYDAMVKALGNELDRMRNSHRAVTAGLFRELSKLRNEVATDPHDDARDYRTLADEVIKWFNPADDDVAEVAIHMDAVKAAARYIESLACRCTPEAVHYDDEPCARCAALGRVADRPEER